ncbi:FMN-dependent NADH-azoreductase [bacterium A37T11]|nr:FMN-dependent NADH-azoreductase [bacterium A37T11]
MTTHILRIITSPRGEASVSTKLGNAIVGKIKAKYPDSVVKERNLATHPLPHLDDVTISSFFTPTKNLSAEQSNAISFSDKAINELQEADIIVLDTPMYNFTITSTLKTYLDHIVRRGITFQVTENGIEGLLKDKKVYLAFSASGNYSNGGSEQAFDFVVPLIKAVFGWLGMADITVFRVEGFRDPKVQEAVVLQQEIDRIAIS